VVGIESDKHKGSVPSPFGLLSFLITFLFLKSVPHWFAKIYAKELNPKGT